MVFGDDTMMPTKVILRKLAEIEEAPWGDIKGKPLDERGIARRLKEYGIRSKNLKLDAGVVAKGYTRADLFDAWARYLPPPPGQQRYHRYPKAAGSLGSASSGLARIWPKCAHCGWTAREVWTISSSRFAGAATSDILHADCVTAADPDQLACRA